VRGKSLGINVSRPPKRGWHKSGDRTGMISLLFTFFTLAALLCAVVGTDSPGR
jgi:hypothetical protein